MKDKNKSNIIKMNRETERRIGKGERSKIEARMQENNNFKKKNVSRFNLSLKFFSLSLFIFFSNVSLQIKNSGAASFRD